MGSCCVKAVEPIPLVDESHTAVLPPETSATHDDEGEEANNKIRKTIDSLSLYPKASQLTVAPLKENDDTVEGPTPAVEGPSPCQKRLSLPRTGIWKELSDYREAQPPDGRKRSVPTVRDSSPIQSIHDYS